MPDDRPLTTSAARSAPMVARELGDDVKLLISQEIALAKLEVMGAVKRVGVAIALFSLAGMLGLYMLGFLLGAVARALEGPLPDWGAWLATAGIIVIVMGILGLVGKSLLPDGVHTEATTQEAMATMAVVRERAQEAARAFAGGTAATTGHDGADHG